VMIQPVCASAGDPARRLTGGCCCQGAHAAGGPYVSGLDWTGGRVLRACGLARACSRTAARYAHGHVT
jgi:hypothetical protein